MRLVYIGVDKSLARPRRKQANVSVRMARISFGALPCKEKNFMTACVSMLLKSRASLTSFRACFLPGRPRDLSASRYIHNYIHLFFTILRKGFQNFNHRRFRFQSQMILIPADIGGVNAQSCSIDRNLLILAILYLDAQQGDWIPLKLQDSPVPSDIILLMATISLLRRFTSAYPDNQSLMSFYWVMTSEAITSCQSIWLGEGIKGIAEEVSKTKPC